MIRARMQTKLDIPEEKIRDVLSRILASRTFDGVGRLKSFLEFVVRETLAGRGDQLKEFAVGEYAFGKGSSFDPRNDPIVRVQARRLRALLERYRQTEGQNDELYIDMPKGGYVPAFHLRDTSRERHPVTAVLLDRNSVMVQAFEALSGDPVTEQLCCGLTQDTVHALLQLDGLTVHSRTDTRKFELVDRGTYTSAGTAATVVTGSVQRRGEHLRITAKLIDAASGTYVASETLDRAIADSSFQLQDEVAGLVASRLREGLSPTGWRHQSNRPPRNLAAHNLYLQARYQLDQRTEGSLRLAASLFEKAIAEDGQFSEAYAGLANAYELLGHYGVIAPVEVWTKAPSAAGMAVLLDDRSAEAHAALAHVRSTQDWDWIGSEHEFRRALELDPRNSTANHWYAMSCLAPMGRLDEALESIQQAHALAPLSSIVTRDMAVLRLYRREYDLALEMCDQAIELNPYFSQAYWTLGFIQEQRHEQAEAVAAFTRAQELAPGSPRYQGALGRMLALAGDRSAALSILKELQQLGEKRYISPLIFASLQFALDQQEMGYRSLRKAFEDRCYELTVINVDPKYDSFRTNPVFMELVTKLGLPAARNASPN
jgi:TolB-like protein/Flp pilus assembly protein TadD